MRRALLVPAVLATVVCLSIAWTGGIAQATTQSLGKATLIQAPAGAATDPNAICLVGCGLSVASAVRASETHMTSRCATFDAKGGKYGVYIAKGRVKCSVAKEVLRAIANGKGKYVNNGYSYNSYTLFDGWLCPSGNMGEQTCEHSKHPVNNPGQDIMSLSCTFVGAGCPMQTAVVDR